MQLANINSAQANMDPEPLSFVTSNADKVREANLVLPFPVKQVRIELQELQSADLEEIVRHKAGQAWRAVQAPLIVEDTALRFLAWRQMPGPFIKYFVANLGLLGVVDSLSPAKDWRAEAITGIGYADGTAVHYFEGRVQGQIVLPQGKEVFGWDAIFRPNGSGRTFAEMEHEEKVIRSMRTLALRKLAEHMARPAAGGGNPAATRS
jgi:non-canonical purine NTP pyrophosphatase (RdgB/HAM1 family)